MLKRAFDILAASVGLVLLSPAIAVLVLLVKATSPGPGIFSQPRVGRNSVPFNCHKLRTMHNGAPHVPTHEAGPGHITPLGRLLRRTKLDELPQLYDVLVGKMSFVGPRPCLLSQSELVRLRVERGVLAVRPGMTGLAQIQGVDMSEPLRLAEIDAEYVRNATMMGDIRIILSTLLTRKGRGDRMRS